MPSVLPRSLPPDVEAILKGLMWLLEDDEEQNDTVPEPYRSQISGGLNCDELPNARGEFGRTPSNPIPANGPLGEVLLLSRLRTNAGSPVMFHRVRAEDGLTGAVDAYEVLSIDGRTRDALYLSMYHPRKSRKAPRGYTYAAKLDPGNFMYGVNHIVVNFPEKLDAYIRKWQMEMFGIPLPVGGVREAVNGSRLRPSVLDDEESSDIGSPQGQIRDDLLKLVHAMQDPRFKGKSIAVGRDGLVRGIPEWNRYKRPSMLLKSALRAYFGIGGILATIMWASYLWPLGWGASANLPNSTFYERSMMMIYVQPIAVLSGATRFVFWGPSLVVWAVRPSGYSFGEWLAPGAYLEGVDSPGK